MLGVPVRIAAAAIIAELSASPEPTGVWAVVVAAGRGERLGGSTSRSRSRSSAADRSSRRVSSGSTLSDWIEAIVVVAPPDWEEPTILLAEELGAGKVTAAVPGGDTRADSVRAGLAEVPEEVPVVLVHDAARPLVSEAVVERVLGALGDGVDGVAPALPLADTVKRAEGDARDRDARSERALRRADAAGVRGLGASRGDRAAARAATARRSSKPQAAAFAWSRATRRSSR